MLQHYDQPQTGAAPGENHLLSDYYLSPCAFPQKALHTLNSERGVQVRGTLSRFLRNHGGPHIIKSSLTMSNLKIQLSIPTVQVVNHLINCLEISIRETF